MLLLLVDKYYALKYASIKGHLKCIKYLHPQVYNIVISDEALEFAASMGHLECIKYLHQNGASIRSNEDRALRWAAANGHIECANYIKAAIEEIDDYY